MKAFDYRVELHKAGDDVVKASWGVGYVEDGEFHWEKGVDGYSYTNLTWDEAEEIKNRLNSK
jgi:hypothetical protein